MQAMVKKKITDQSENVHSLPELLVGLADVPATARSCVIHDLTLDSRRVSAGDLFLALPGVRQNGMQFIDDALQRGAAAVAYDAATHMPASRLGKPLLPVADLRAKVGAIAARYHGHPSDKLDVVGVTGTNGKTTCAYLLTQAFASVRQSAVFLGTLGYGPVGNLRDTGLTTPDAVTLQRLFAEFAAEGTQRVCMEVSSHALDQGRVNGTTFRGAIFTNLSRDHLDYHQNMEAYAASKAKLFAFADLEFAVINTGDEYGRRLAADVRGKINVLTYGAQDADFRAVDVSLQASGLTLRAATPKGEIELRSVLSGRFNVDNLLAVVAALSACGFTAQQIAAALAQAKPAPGRCEKFGGTAGQPLVIVDYAHSPDALEKVLLALREQAPAKLWCVFGCGGNRDRGKRPEMGRVAERYADEIILTDDNPRHEVPADIVRDIQGGITKTDKVHVLHDRAAAIRYAIRTADARDVILVAGKGHETYQQFGEQRVPFDDRRAVEHSLQEKT